MTTVGYGDITPTNVYEAVLLIFGLVIASGLFAYMFKYNLLIFFKYKFGLINIKNNF